VSSLENRRLWGELVAAFLCFKGASKKDGDRLFIRACSDRTRVNSLKLKEMGHKEEFFFFFFYHKGGETLEGVAQRTCGCPITGSVPGQVGLGFEQPGLVKDVAAHSKGIGLEDL